MKENATTLTVAQAAMLLGRSERWLQDVARRGYITKAAPGRYSLVELVRGAARYYEDLLEKSNRAAAASGATDARTREIELRIADRTKGLMPLADASAVVDEIQGLYRQEFSGLPARFTKDRKRRRQLGIEIEAAFARLDEVADRARQNLADGFEE